MNTPILQGGDTQFPDSENAISRINGNEIILCDISPCALILLNANKSTVNMVGAIVSIGFQKFSRDEAVRTFCLHAVGGRATETIVNKKLPSLEL